MPCCKHPTWVPVYRWHVSHMPDDAMSTSISAAANVPLFLYPFLNTTSKTRPFEYLRLTSLGVIGALVKIDDTEVINFLLSTEIIPLCLKTMEMGSELSKTVATFIVQKILIDQVGLNYVCHTAERFFAVQKCLVSLVESLQAAPSVRLLKHIIRCFLRLTDNARAREALRTHTPLLLLDPDFTACLKDDGQTRQWLAQLLANVGLKHPDPIFAEITEPTQPLPLPPPEQ
ncbi:CCR4-NOT transcription complex subunit 9 [Coccomyxa viridis]|uniref:CCR4-NOT transcription complex subunit 9 n=1 Tax=Coccomyxa viridis TaxID=1274662 RepID=A0AAV1HTP0_9CHLO|nr:CCR4-NOT transcription complex subunit 9 [Coccomyxa viridis]